MENIKSVLTLQNLVFDTIQFNRKGFKRDNELKFRFQVQIGKSNENNYKVTLILTGDKQGEYDILISLSGFFKIEGQNNLEDKVSQDLINKNAVAIIMPYLRSELTLLTAQPGTESVVLPPFNINKILEQQQE